MKVRAADRRQQEILQACIDYPIHKNCRLLLDEATDDDLITIKCSSGCTPLHYAAGNGHVELVDYLITRRHVDANVKAHRKSQGRTPLHYACRNGHLRCAQRLVELGAHADHRAKHGVTPFQLAIWKNQLAICQWLVDDCGVDPAQTNDFECGAVHWIGISTDTDRSLLPLVEWLVRQPNIGVKTRQRQGHSALHKAAWGGHLALVRYWHQEHDLWDDTPDHAGNYAVDLCDMANSETHDAIADYLRRHASRDRHESYRSLGLDENHDHSEDSIRQAYKRLIILHHPDKNDGDATHFNDIQRAYQHLMEDGGLGRQRNPAHQLPLMLQSLSTSEADEDHCIKVRLVAVLLEYGDKGLDLSNLKKKWQQVWPSVAFPATEMPLKDWIQSVASDVIDVRKHKKSIRLFPLNCSRHKVLELATAASSSQ